MKILWLDDEPDNIEFIAEALMADGHQVELVSAVEAAIEQLENTGYDIMLLDQQLPLPGIDVKYENFVWAGCIILRWLRGNGDTIENAADNVKKQIKYYIEQGQPLAANSRIPVAICSAFFDKQVIKALKSSSTQDNHIQILLKPLDIEQIFSFIKRHQKG